MSVLKVSLYLGNVSQNNQYSHTKNEWLLHGQKTTKKTQFVFNKLSEIRSLYGIHEDVADVVCLFVCCLKLDGEVSKPNWWTTMSWLIVVANLLASSKQNRKAAQASGLLDGGGVRCSHCGGTGGQWGFGDGFWGWHGSLLGVHCFLGFYFFFSGFAPATILHWGVGSECCW